jgi:hypothetical protein
LVSHPIQTASSSSAILAVFRLRLTPKGMVDSSHQTPVDQPPCVHNTGWIGSAASRILFLSTAQHHHNAVSNGQRNRHRSLSRERQRRSNIALCMKATSQPVSPTRQP